MQNTYVKSFIENDDCISFKHFEDDQVVRQLDIYPERFIMASSLVPTFNEKELSSTRLSTISEEEKDEISEEKFERSWEQYLSIYEKK